jgi:hypothetical protein
MKRAASLVKRYVPPDAAHMQAAMQAGKGTLKLAAGGKVALIFRDYDRPGDEFSLMFDGPGKRVDGVKVRSYLDGPEDAVGLSQSLLDAPAKKVQVKTL